MQTVHKLILLSDRKNVLDAPDDFSNAAWVKLGGSAVTADAVGAPVRPGLADLCKEGTDLGQHGVNQAKASIVGIDYSGAVVAKAKERSVIYLGFANLANGSVWFDLSAGTKGTQQANVQQASIVALGDGWYLCAATWLANSTANYLTLGIASADNVASYTGDGASGLYLARAKLSVGPALLSRV